jgi:radical SAM-linked protein
MRVQRLRVDFRRGPQLRFITHLDLMRFWERALRRAAVNVAYSEGFSPHPQISLAAPLPVGVTSRGELMDVFLAAPMPEAAFREALAPQLPPGLCINTVESVPLADPSLQSQLHAAEYAVELPPGEDLNSLRQRVDDLLARTEIPWTQKREKVTKTYDLRPLILQLRIAAAPETNQLELRLRAGNEATGRPDQLLAALGLAPELPIERTRLLLSHDSETAA